jgi:feruloyl esterase
MSFMHGLALPALGSVVLFAACASKPGAPPPQVAQPGVARAACEVFAQQFTYPGLHLLESKRVAAGTLKVPGIGEAMPEHCVIEGRLNERTSPVDGKQYAIGFEMRLPTQWNGRFFYQANGGLDGFVTPAYGNILGGGPRTNGLQKGFAVLSSDAGHAFDRSNPVIGGATFGLDPQARLDYGYNAVAQLAPMARALMTAYYGRTADRAYLVGSSNGGRHGMVAAARDQGGFDGILVTTPGYRLPLAAVTQVWDAQQFATVARARKPDGVADLETSFTPAEMQVLSDAILARCDALDGARDGLVGDLAGCQRAFDPLRDIASCPGDAGEHCLSGSRKQVLARVFAGPGFYPGMAWDPGVRGRNWREWKYVNSVGPRDAIALAFVFTTPPMSPQVVSGGGTTVPDYALRFDKDSDGRKVYAREGVYTQSAMEFMTPPEPTVMRSFVARGGKIIVAHGSADPVFSVLDSIRWYEGFVQQHGPRQDSARLYPIPGMNHSSGGPAADQFDLVDGLVAWVERGVAPQAVVASVRGADSNLPNPEIPADWSPRRTRLLCPWPQVARYRGSGDVESAASFQCMAP